uniref:Uncharacterized protein n=1 Tax=Peromyscus maniculatus bairdii TaxID=230844 RepID=A0A8C8UEN9_PERMB
RSGSFGSFGRRRLKPPSSSPGPLPYCPGSGFGAGPQSSLAAHASRDWQQQPTRVKWPLSGQCAQGVSGTGAVATFPSCFCLWPRWHHTSLAWAVYTLCPLYEAGWAEFLRRAFSGPSL